MLLAFIIAIALFAYVAVTLMLPYGTARTTLLPRNRTLGEPALPDNRASRTLNSRAVSAKPPQCLLEAPASSPAFCNQPDLSDLTDQLYFPAA